MSPDPIIDVDVLIREELVVAVVAVIRSTTTMMLPIIGLILDVHQQPIAYILHTDNVCLFEPFLVHILHYLLHVPSSYGINIVNIVMLLLILYTVASMLSITNTTIFCQYSVMRCINVLH